MKRLLVAFVMVVLIATGCSTASGVISQSSEGDTDQGATPPPTDPPVAGSPDTDAPRDVPPLSLPVAAPGTDEAYQQMIVELDRFVTEEQRAAGVPWPEARNPDPVAAYQSSAAFQNWMSENNVTPTLVEAYTAPGSPERGWDIELFGTYAALDVLSTPSNPPYSMQVEDLVHPAATGITDALLDQVPDGSAAVVYWDSAGRSQLVRPDGTVMSDDEGWTNVGPWVAIMAPTEVGWQVWFDELTEPPPAGDARDRGLPNQPPERLDL